MYPIHRTLNPLLLAAGLVGFATSGARAADAPAVLKVDARDASRRVLHATLHLPARPGPLTLLYPKWMPGEHGPTGPISDLVGLKMTAAGQPVAWQRDPLDNYAFQLGFEHHESSDNRTPERMLIDEDLRKRWADCFGSWHARRNARLGRGT